MHSDSETLLEYDSNFDFGMVTNVETTATGLTIDVNTVVSSTSLSTVDATHSTNDTHFVERELVEGDVVETVTKNHTGQFSTDAELVSDSDTVVEGSYDYSMSGGGGGGGLPPGPGLPPPPTTPPFTIETHISWSDNRSSTTTMTAEQSGGYGDGEEDASSSSLTITSVDEYFSTMEGEDNRDMDGYVTSGSFTHESEGRTEHVFSDEKSFTSAGNSASWYTSFETESSWSVHAEITEFGYTIIVDDSDEDSYSESSGAQSYEPGEEDDPSGPYRPMGGDGDGEGNSGGSGEGTSERTSGSKSPIGKLTDMNGDGRITSEDLRLKRQQLALLRKFVKEQSKYYAQYNNLGVLTHDQQKELEAWLETRAYMDGLIDQGEVDLLAMKNHVSRRDAANAVGPKINRDPHGIERWGLMDAFLARGGTWENRRAWNRLQRDMFYVGTSDEFRKWHEYYSGMWTDHDDFMDAAEWDAHWQKARDDAYSAMAGIAGHVPSGRPSLSPQIPRRFGTPTSRYFPPLVPRTGPVSPKTKLVIPSPKETTVPSNVLTDAQAAAKAIKSGTRPAGWTGKWGDPHGNKEGNLPRTDAFGNPITYREYYLPKNPGETTKWGGNRLVVGSDGSVYVTTTHYGQSGNPPFVYVGEL